MSLAPIILFCYNRADKTKRVLEDLAKNNLAKESDLFIFCDGPRNEDGLKKITEVHKVIDSVTGFKTINITKRTLNRGLSKSVICGVGEVLEKYEKVIVLEDDICVAKNFLDFMNQALNVYESDKRVFTISGFNFHNYHKPKDYQEDIFFFKGRNSSWGWAIWKDRWQEVDFDVKDYESFKNDKQQQADFNQAGSNLCEILKMQMEKKVDTWDIQMTYTMFKKGAYCLFPVRTLVKNVGFDNSGIHCSNNDSMSNFEFSEVSLRELKFKSIDEIKNNELAANNYLKAFNHNFSNKKLFSSKKILRIKYIVIGMILTLIIELISKFI